MYLIRLASVFLFGCLVAGVTQAQQSVEEEVRRLVRDSISSTVSQVLSESLSSEGQATAAAKPKATIFANPLYNHVDGDFGNGEFDVDTVGGILGGLMKARNGLFLHGSAAYARSDLSGDDEDITAVALLGGFDAILHNTPTLKVWITGEGTLARTYSDDQDFEGKAWVLSSSITASYRNGDWITEPSAGFSFVGLFDEDDADFETVKAIGGSLKFKHRGQYWRPQLNLSVLRQLDPKAGEDLIVSGGPEVNYAVRPDFLVGAKYEFLTPIGADGYDLDSHTFTGTLRWTF